MNVDHVYLERIRKEFTGTQLHHDLDTKENQPVFMDCTKIFRPDVPTFWAPLKSGVNTIVAGGNGVGSTTGSVVHDKYARFTTNTSYISWDGTSNADVAQVGCIKFRLSNWAFAVAAAGHCLLSISKAAGDTANQIKLHVNGTGTSAFGNLSLTVRDSAGSAFINAVVLGNIINEYTQVDALDIELNYDFTVGATRLFINGKQFGSTITSTGTRNTLIDLIRINGDAAGAQSSEFLGYSDLRIYSTVQHTADFEVFEPCAFLSLTGTISGLNYLEDQEVRVLVDGNLLGSSFTPASGQITLGDDAFSTILVGMTYTHTVEIQAVDLGTGIGSAMGSIKRIDRAVVNFEKTAAASVGSSTTLLEEIVFRTATTPMGDPITLVTAQKVIDLKGDYDREARAIITGSDPLPCTVTCIALRGITADV
jgi:hypothetical protein